MNLQFPRTFKIRSVILLIVKLLILKLTLSSVSYLGILGWTYVGSSYGTSSLLPVVLAKTANKEERKGGIQSQYATKTNPQ